MIKDSSRPVVRRAVAWGLLAALAGCSGPQSLSTATRPEDKQAYAQALAKHPNSPRDAFFAWKVSEGADAGKHADAASDEELSETKNPFSRKDLAAVSRGAVIYQAHCVSCHGENADGRGPAMPQALPKMDFHTFGKRFAITLHGGAPKKWFRMISDGYTSDVRNPDGTVNAMPAFRDVLAREQIWLAITYLQSLDKDAPK
jgi:mono/diheme cytochrome c family protein